MAGFWLAFCSSFRFHRFDDDELETSFQQKYHQLGIQSCHLWFAIQAFHVVAWTIGSVCFLPLFILDAAFWALFAVPLMFGAVLVALFHSGVVMGSHLIKTLSICHWLTLAMHCLQTWLFLTYCRERHWGLSTDDPLAIDAADQGASFLCLILCHVDQQLQLLPLLNLGLSPASLVTILAGPIANLLLTALAMPAHPIFLAMCGATSFHAAVAFVYCRDGSSLQRSLFLLEQQKARHSEQMQRTDATVNHILKNAMMEASGLIDVFLELCIPPPPPDLVATYLHGALGRLQTGMAWCRRRGALLALTKEDTMPTPKPTCLAALGSVLVRARTMTSSFAPVTVELDEMLTELMLENALSNAFRHGHPTDPDVRFSISVDLADATAGACTVTFLITNRCDPKRQPLTAELVRGMTQSGRPSCAEGSGLQHCFWAAQLQGMAASLTQEGDTVVFHVSLFTHRVSEAPAPVATPAMDSEAGTLPPGLKISVMDDSATARMLLKHQLSRSFPGCVIDTFGESAEDVDPFLSHTLLSADIAILDQHLDWPSGSLFLGTDLVRLLLQAGFRGFICIRSANTSEEDIPQYFAAGAHCVLDKLLDRAQTVATLVSNYQQFLSAHFGRSTTHSLPPRDMVDPLPMPMTTEAQDVPFGVVL